MEGKLQIVMIDIDGQGIKRKSTRDTDNFSEEQSIQNIQLDHPHLQFSRNSHNRNIQSNSTQDRTFCRICLQNQEEGNRLIKSCNCRDLIHQKCLLQWIQHRNQMVDISQNIKCQICRNDYNVQIQSILTFTCQIFKQKYSHFRKQFARSCIQFLIFFALFVFTAVILAKMYLSLGFSRRMQQLLSLPTNTIVALIIMIVLFLGIFSLGLCYRLALEYCYGITLRIKQNIEREEDQ